MAHYYEKTGSGVEPRHFVGVSSRPGELRPTRITDARKKAWYPSVTTIQGLLDKPALTDWKIQEHLKQAYKIAFGEHGYPFGPDSFIKDVKIATQDALDKAPKDGTDFHDVLEKWFTGEDLPDPQADMCHGVEDRIQLHTKVLGGWRCEKSFVHILGFAGKVDLHSKAPNGSDAGWVVDFKTKNSADKWKPGKMHYPEMAMQLAAYRVGLGLDNASCANVFICLEDGAVEFHEWDSAELDKQFANFTDLLRIWLRNAGYIPGKPQ